MSNVVCLCRTDRFLQLFTYNFFPPDEFLHDPRDMDNKRHTNPTLIVNHSEIHLILLYVGAYVYIYSCMCVRAEVDTGCLLLLFSTLSLGITISNWI